MKDNVGVCCCQIFLLGFRTRQFSASFGHVKIEDFVIFSLAISLQSS